MKITPTRVAMGVAIGAGAGYVFVVGSAARTTSAYYDTSWSSEFSALISRPALAWRYFRAPEDVALGDDGIAR